MEVISGKTLWCQDEHLMEEIDEAMQ
jgi:hypothetical protein